MYLPGEPAYAGADRSTAPDAGFDSPDRICKAAGNSQKELNREAKADDELAGLPDSVRLARLQNTFGVFADAMIGEEGSTVLENELIEVRLANKGGRIGYVRLKKYDNYKGEPFSAFR